MNLLGRAASIATEATRYNATKLLLIGVYKRPEILTAAELTGHITDAGTQMLGRETSSVLKIAKTCLRESSSQFEQLLSSVTALTKILT